MLWFTYSLHHIYHIMPHTVFNTHDMGYITKTCKPTMGWWRFSHSSSVALAPMLNGVYIIYTLDYSFSSDLELKRQQCVLKLPRSILYQQHENQLVQLMNLIELWEPTHRGTGMWMSFCTYCLVQNKSSAFDKLGFHIERRQFQTYRMWLDPHLHMH